ncbi:MAG: C39 family peptidase [Clostridia bacterium]|nr:C39 family peptidase [Clostridia bacterium]
MAENNRPVAEPLQKTMQAAQAVRGAVKTGKAIAAAAKGAAAGGVWGAIGAFAWENRKFLTKVLIAATAVLMIPIIILCMLPSVIFGGFGDSHSAADPNTPILNSSVAIDSNLTQISTTVSTVLSERMTEVLQAIEDDYANCTADGMEIINPHESAPNFNANLFVGQYCAAKNEDYTTVSIADMESMLRQGKDKLYSYTKKEEQRSVETITETVTVDASTGEETVTQTVTVTTENWIVYTVVYNGESYFADEVFHLTSEQKDLADDYAYNLSLFLGDSMFQGLPDGYTSITSLGNVRFTDGQTEVVYFNQLDERYSNMPYGTDDIGGYGCGPTAMSIVVSSLTSETVDPIAMARWSYENGYWCSKSGSYHALIPAAAKEWGLNVEGCSASEGQKIVDALSNGKLVVAIMLKGHFTSSGHFIVLRGVKDGKILVADPASYDRSSMEWDLSIILNEASKNAGAGGPFWIIG